MLPDNFNFALLPPGSSEHTLQSLGMLASTIETIDYAITSWVKEDLELSALTNEGYRRVPVLWQVPERSYQIKKKKDLRDDGGALKLPLISIERTGITKDPARKGGFQANLYSSDRNGRVGRWVIAKRIVQDKTRNFAVAASMRQLPKDGTYQKYYPRINRKVVIQSLSVPIPIYINVDYKIVIKTEYQQQMNELVQPFIGRTGQIDAFVMRRNGHLYEAFIDQNFNHSNNINNLAEDTRLFSTEITIRVLGYLMGEGENDDRPIVRVEENTVEVTFPRELGPVPGNDGFFMK
ncbi:hypothetical protein CMI37_11365 [Candidatus Pacearchaeota archaeon]|nr:hypothetical protein [Candidatus Pacearchaeota archaeon]|tara:strand:+ start:2273 stop:3151 length:879 start_codon:yes stop_codon:yes gene_type:complete